ncbi:hypothetical protein ACWCP6_19675 [Streptomyces sp. NPDC002004]
MPSSPTWPTSTPHGPSPSESRARLDRVRASLGIASLALQHIEDDLNADAVDRPELAAILRELH